MPTAGDFSEIVKRPSQGIEWVQEVAVVYCGTGDYKQSAAFDTGIGNAKVLAMTKPLKMSCKTPGEHYSGSSSQHFLSN